MKDRRELLRSDVSEQNPLPSCSLRLNERREFREKRENIFFNCKGG